MLIHKQGDGLTLRDAHQVGIAMATQTITVCCASLVEHASDLMRRVAIHACRDNIRLLLPEPALDHLDVDLFDLCMALCARRRDIVAVNARLRISVRKNLVRRVTRGANGGHRQALPEQTGPVDRQRVILEYRVLMDGVRSGYRGTLSMTFTAQHWDVHHPCGGQRVGLGKHVVRTVAVAAAWRQRISARGGLTV